MIWECMYARGMGKFQFLDGTVNTKNYEQILQESPLLSALTSHPEENYIFQQNSFAPHKAKYIKKIVLRNRIYKFFMARQCSLKQKVKK